jgi:hypothetical protein
MVAGAVLAPNAHGLVLLRAKVHVVASNVGKLWEMATILFQKRLIALILPRSTNAHAGNVSFIPMFYL